MFGTFNDQKANAEKAVEAQISKMGAEVEDEEEHASEVLDKAAEPYYIAASPMVNVNIGQKRIAAFAGQWCRSHGDDCRPCLELRSPDIVELQCQYVSCHREVKEVHWSRRGRPRHGRKDHP